MLLVSYLLINGRTSCYRLVLFRSTAGVTTKQLEEAASQMETELEEAASQMETYLNQRFVHALARQQCCQPDEVAILLSTKSKMERTLKNLSDEGYESGPPVGPELALVEGQPIIVRFRGNISEVDGRPVKLTHNNNIIK